MRLFAHQERGEAILQILPDAFAPGLPCMLLTILSTYDGLHAAPRQTTTTTAVFLNCRVLDPQGSPDRTMSRDLAYPGQPKNPAESRGGDGSVRGAGVPARGGQAGLGTSAVGFGATPSSSSFDFQLD